MALLLADAIITVPVMAYALAMTRFWITLLKRERYSNIFK
mgnify:CR=1 FL=1